MKSYLGKDGVEKLTRLCKNEIINEISDIKAYIGYTDSDIYGIECDFENKVFTRLAGAIGKTSGADFDGINAFGGRRRCELLDSGEVIAYYGDTIYEGDGYNNSVSSLCQIMVEQPRFYYKVVPLKIERGTEGWILRKARYYISDAPKAGFKLHPAFIKNGVELDKVYLSAYEGSIYHTNGLTNAEIFLANDEQVADFDSDKLMSLPTVKPASGSTQRLTRANARKLAHNRGDGWDQAIIQTVSATQLLFLIEYGTFNSQAAIGTGVVYKASGNGNEAEKTGATSSLGNASVSVINSNGYNVVSYRGEENFWGNIWTWDDGINIENPIPFTTGQVGTVYIADHDFEDDVKTGSYKNTGIHPAYGDGFVSAFGYSEEFDWLFIPVEYAGNSTLPVGDYFWNSYSGWATVRAHGKWDIGLFSGAFAWNLNTRATDYSYILGSRLIYRPTPKEVSA